MIDAMITNIRSRHMDSVHLLRRKLMLDQCAVRRIKWFVTRS